MKWYTRRIDTIAFILIYAKLGNFITFHAIHIIVHTKTHSHFWYAMLRWRCRKILCIFPNDNFSVSHMNTKFLFGDVSERGRGRIVQDSYYGERTGASWIHRKSSWLSSLPLSAEIHIRLVNTNETRGLGKHSCYDIEQTWFLTSHVLFWSFQFVISREKQKNRLKSTEMIPCINFQLPT